MKTFSKKRKTLSIFLNIRLVRRFLCTDLLPMQCFCFKLASVIISERRLIFVNNMTEKVFVSFSQNYTFVNQQTNFSLFDFQSVFQVDFNHINSGSAY